MRLSLTLSAYIGRQFAVRFGAVLLALTALVYLLDTIEMLRRASTRQEVTLAIVLELSLLKLPQLVQEMIPFVVLFATMLTFWRLSRSHELTVVRAAGISVWQFLLPALAIALLIGAFRLAVLNPVGAVLYASYEQTEIEAAARPHKPAFRRPVGFLAAPDRRPQQCGDPCTTRLVAGDGAL